MGKNTAFAIERFEKSSWQIEAAWNAGILKEASFHPLQLMHYTPSLPVYGIARLSEFVAILCGDGNTAADVEDDEFWCIPISQHFGLPSDVSAQVLEEFNNTSDPDTYGKPVCISLRQLLEYDFTSGWNNAKKQKEPFSENVLKLFNCLINELQKMGTPDKVRIVFWFF